MPYARVGLLPRPRYGQELHSKPRQALQSRHWGMRLTNQEPLMALDYENILWAYSIMILLLHLNLIVVVVVIIILIIIIIIIISSSSSSSSGSGSGSISNARISRASE